MSEEQHRPILLTTPEGTSSVIHKMDELSLDRKLDSQDPKQKRTLNTPFSDNAARETTTSNGGGVQFDAEQIERGRSRIKRRSDNNNANNQGSEHSSRSTSRSFSRSRSRSRSRTASRIRDEEFLKWTVLRQDPSMRLHNYKVKYNKKTVRMGPGAETSGTGNETNKGQDDDDEEEVDDDEEDEDEDDEDDDDDDDEEEDDEDEEEEEESDEEQVSDIENDNAISEQFNYDLGTKVLPNYCININEVLDSSKAWIAKYETETHDPSEDNINITSLEGGYIRGVLTLHKDKTSKQETKPTDHKDSYVLYVDLTSESIYVITYVLGTLVKNGDTVYIVHWHSDRQDFVSDVDIKNNITKLRNHVMHLFDCVSATIDDLDVVILSLTHPYPKHLLNEMINGLQPIALCCSLSMTLSGLQNFVCSVPTFIIRKKLKRAKKKGIFD